MDATVQLLNAIITASSLDIYRFSKASNYLERLCITLLQIDLSNLGLVECIYILLAGRQVNIQIMHRLGRMVGNQTTSQVLNSQGFVHLICAKVRKIDVCR